jgi:hypothetical protein
MGRIEVGCGDAAIDALAIRVCQCAYKNYRQAGIRFQQTEDGQQYVIPIIQEPNLPSITMPDDPNRVVAPFVPMADQKPLKLGAKIAVAANNSASNETADADNRVSVIFSPTGAISSTRVIMKCNPDLPNDWLYGSTGLFREESTGHQSMMAFYMYDRKLLEISDDKDEFFRALRPVHLRPPVAPMRR